MRAGIELPLERHEARTSCCTDTAIRRRWWAPATRWRHSGEIPGARVYAGRLGLLWHGRLVRLRALRREHGDRRAGVVSGGPEAAGSKIAAPGFFLPAPDRARHRAPGQHPVEILAADWRTSSVSTFRSRNWQFRRRLSWQCHWGTRLLLHRHAGIKLDCFRTSCSRVAGFSLPMASPARSLLFRGAVAQRSLQSPGSLANAEKCLAAFGRRRSSRYG